jgi:hypothetical protein
MVWERMSVGLDVHARSVVAGVIDGHTGELWSERLAPTSELVVAWVLAWVVAWVLGLPGPVGVAYEAGPTGFGLARALAAVGVRCVVVAPSKLASWSGHPAIGSRPTGGMRSGWLGCCASGSCRWCGCRPWLRRRAGSAARQGGRAWGSDAGAAAAVEAAAAPWAGVAAKRVDPRAPAVAARVAVGAALGAGGLR